MFLNSTPLNESTCGHLDLFTLCNQEVAGVARNVNRRKLLCALIRRIVAPWTSQKPKSVTAPRVCCHLATTVFQKIKKR